MELPRDILERAERVYRYHQASKFDENGRTPPPVLAHMVPPRLFAHAPKVPLLPTLLDLPIGVLTLQEEGLEGVPLSQISPPQDLKTLSTWLYMTYGMIKSPTPTEPNRYTRPCPSLGEAYPGEIYVAAFAIEGLEPGLYHYSAREFALRKLRDGQEALSLIKRGRPDLEFIRESPGALLVSTVFARSALKFAHRGYRAALVDAGHVIGNITSVATALGIQTMTRLRLTDATLRELIGVTSQTDFAADEAVQGMVVWATQASKPMQTTRSPLGAAQALPPIARDPVGGVPPQQVITATHQDCVAPGFVIRDIRPPLTELSPISAEMDGAIFPEPEAEEKGHPMRQVQMGGVCPVNMARRPMPRDALLRMTRLAFRGGSYYPIFPSGPHVGLIRPLWIINDVTGIDSGVWYYHPPEDKWVPLTRGEFRVETGYIAGNSALAKDAAAVCVMAVNLRILMMRGGPDLYRLAHLEAGIVAQRLYLSARSTDFAFCDVGGFYDEEIRKFLGFDRTGWEPIHVGALGIPQGAEDDLADATASAEDSFLGWRD